MGAGPAGTSAAYCLARAGYRTLLLEKEKIPRYKPCGGGLTRKVHAALGTDIVALGGVPIHTASVACAGDRMLIPFDQPLAWCVMRDRFDFYLADRASRAGAQLRDGEPATGIDWDENGVTVATRHERIHARVVVGADGANSVIRRATNFPPYPSLGVAYQAEWSVPPAVLDRWHGMIHMDFGAIERGYGWIFPKTDHLSIGIGALLRPGRTLNLRAELARYIASEPSLAGGKEIFARGHRLPLGGCQARYHAPNAVLVGDAAGLIDPLFAEGIYDAIRSGQIAAEAVAEAFDTGDWRLAGYSRRINAEIGQDLRLARPATFFLYRAPRLAYFFFRHSRRLREILFGIINGEFSYRGSTGAWLGRENRGFEI